MHVLQEKILELAKQEDISVYGYRKLGEKIGVHHPQKVKWHLQKLLKDGFLLRDAQGKLRVLSNNEPSKMLSVPILGLANCGEPLAYADGTELDRLQLSPSLIKGSNQALFAVQATGDSMNACSVGGSVISEGDYVIADSGNTVPKNGDIVVSSIDGLATIKKFIRDESRGVIALVSESTRPRPPIIVAESDADSYIIHGTAVAIIGSYQ